jgi:hypothetical protein
MRWVRVGELVDLRLPTDSSGTSWSHRPTFHRQGGTLRGLLAVSPPAGDADRPTARRADPSKRVATMGSPRVNRFLAKPEPPD